MRVLVTGGAGFIGSALIRYLLTETDCRVVNVDCLTYAASPEALAEVANSDNYVFEHVDICDGPALQAVFLRHDPDAVLHLAAETHVDRSIDAPATFIRTNVAGTCLLLEAAMRHWSRLTGERKERFRFHHVSTDEVFGSLGDEGFFTEETRYAPNSPYSASKASSDHFVRAWHATYGLPVVLTNCSNNYGPYQYPEKLIPLMTLNALAGRRLPVYGTGGNVRDWLFVDDHVRALWLILTRGRVGESYNVGGCNEVRNIDVVHQICDLVDEMAAPLASGPRRGLISYVTDRPGHDFRYAIDAGKIHDEFGWAPRESFASGLRQTVAWYLANGAWCDTVRTRTGYNGGRLGLGSKESN